MGRNNDNFLKIRVRSAALCAISAPLCRRSQLRTTRSLLLCRISCGFAKKWAKISANFLQKAIDFCDLKLYTLKHKIILEKGSTDDEKACNEHGKIL